MQTTTLTPGSLELFLGLAEDAPNWSGMPLVSVSPAQRGNLTHLKKLGLVETIDDEGCAFALFTEAGVAFAAENGIDLDFVRQSYDPRKTDVDAFDRATVEETLDPTFEARS